MRRKKRSPVGSIKRGFPKKKSPGKINSKKHFHDGIEFQSGLEVFAYKKLKEAGLNFEYEPITFEILPELNYPCTMMENMGSKSFIDKSGKKVNAIRYTPDFVSMNSDGSFNWIIETKGYANERFPYSWKMFKKWLVDNNKACPLYLPKDQTQVKICIERIITRQDWGVYM